MNAGGQVTWQGEEFYLGTGLYVSLARVGPMEDGNPSVIKIRAPQRECDYVMILESLVVIELLRWLRAQPGWKDLADSKWAMRELNQRDEQ